MSSSLSDVRTSQVSWKLTQVLYRGQYSGPWHMCAMHMICIWSNQRLTQINMPTTLICWLTHPTTIPFPWNWNIYRSGHALISSCLIDPSPWKWSYIGHGKNLQIRRSLFHHGASLWGVTRVTSMKILGVTITDTLSFEPHVTNVSARCAQTWYALRILRAHGLNGPALWNVTRATLISKLIYASPAWFEFLDESSKTRCQGIIKKLARTGYLGEGFAELCEHADDELFRNIQTNNHHVLHQLLPPIKNSQHTLRPRVHYQILLAKNNAFRNNYIYRMLYEDIYQYFIASNHLFTLTQSRPFSFHSVFCELKYRPIL